MVRGRRAGARRAARAARAAVADDAVDAVAKALRVGRAGRAAARRRGAAASRAWSAASRVAGATGAKLLAETFPARLERGAGRAGRRAPRLPRRVRRRRSSTGLRHLVLVDAKAPVSFFAYPDKPSDLVPDGCEVHVLAGGRRRRGRRARARSPTRSAPARDAAARSPPARPDAPDRRAHRRDGRARRIGALLPEGAIVSDEAQHLRAVRCPAPPPARRATTG